MQTMHDKDVQTHSPTGLDTCSRPTRWLPLMHMVYIEEMLCILEFVAAILAAWRVAIFSLVVKLRFVCKIFKLSSHEMEDCLLLW
jgi:hypothetical protein